MKDEVLISVGRSKARLLAKMLEAREWPDDDGRSEVRFMRENNLTVDEFVTLCNEFDRLRASLAETKP